MGGENDFVNDVVTTMVLLAVQLAITIGFTLNPSLSNTQQYFYLFYSVTIIINTLYSVNFGKTYQDKILEEMKDLGIILAEGIVLLLLIIQGVENTTLFDSTQYQLILTTLLGFFAGILGIKISTKYTTT
jgi:hypothetical protein